jgi:glutamyl-tRNA reductase
VSDRAEHAMRRVAWRELLPTIRGLVHRLEQIRSAEMQRYRAKLVALGPAQREAVEALTRAILSRVLHGPLCELKARAGAPDQHVLAGQLRSIFGVREQ